MSNSIPEGYHSVTPSLMVKNSLAAIEFYKKALNAELTGIVPLPNGKGTMHATIKIGNSIIMMGDEITGEGCKSAETLGSSPITFYVYVDNVDEMFQKALDAGGIQEMPVQEMFWGDRCGSFKDPFGYSWTVAKHTRDLSSDEVRKGAETFFQK